jgi:hypothetical protein
VSAAAIAALPRRPPPDPRLLRRCLLLAVLLHVWLVLVFGNATGSAAPGLGVWGSLTVKLLGRSGDEAGAPPGDGAAAGERSPGESAGAARQGRWNPRELPPEAAATDAPPDRTTLDLPEGFRPVERENLSPPPARIAPAESTVLPMQRADLARATPAAGLQPPGAELPTPVGRLEARPEAAATVLAPVTRLRPPAPAVEAPPLSSDLPAPVQRLEPASPAAAEAAAALPRPAELRAAPAPAAVAPSTELPPPVRRLEAAAESGAAPALPRATELRPAGAAPPPAMALPNAQDLPAAVRRLESTEGAGAVAPMQPPANARMDAAAPAAAPLSDLSGALPGQVSAPAGPARGDPNTSPFAAPRALPGSPDGGPRAGAEAALPPDAAASAARAPLNLSLPRGDIGARRGPGLVELLPQPPERKSRLEQSIEDAANKDCRKAYSNAGILAAVPLAIDAARGKGCRW